MSVREYIGARYVPKFADPAEWSNTKEYEPLTIVLNEGNSYTSRKFVPVGVDISNDDYWVLTGNYNSQIEAYRKEVQDVSDAVETLNTAVGLSDKTGLIFIGDSFTAGSSNEQWTSTWPSDLTNAMKNTESVDYSVAGTGWAYTLNGKNFLTQCQQAAADKKFSDYGRVVAIVYGGINDVFQTSDLATVKNNIRSGLALLRNAYPDIEIHMAGINIPAYVTDYQSYFNAWQEEALIGGGYIVFHDCRGWFRTRKTDYGSDNIHPNNSSGNDILKSKWLSLITGASEWFNTCTATVKTVNVNNPTVNTWAKDLLDNLNFTMSEGTLTVTSKNIPVTSIKNSAVMDRTAKGSVLTPEFFVTQNNNFSVGTVPVFFRTTKAFNFYATLGVLPSGSYLYTVPMYEDTSGTEVPLNEGDYISLNGSITYLD